MVAPKGTPKEIVDRLHAAMRKSLDDPETRDKLVALGITVRGSSPKEFGDALRKQYALYRTVIQTNGIKAD
jgi:tripartite-type tricarboxylate transporter receptor subunit TctC